MPVSETDLPAGARRAFPGASLPKWLSARYKLRNAGYGTSVPRVYERMSHLLAVQISPDCAIDFADFVSRIAIKAGLKTAEDTCLMVEQQSARFTDANAFSEWCETVRMIYQTAPAALDPFLQSQPVLLEQLNMTTLRQWTQIGLNFGKRDPETLQAYFSLNAPEARVLLYDVAGDIAFRDVAPMMRSYVKALYRSTPIFHALGPPKQGDPAQRSRFASGMMWFPQSYRETTDPHRARLIYQAAVAHLGAHLRFSPPPMPHGKLKPIQIALIDLLEDARVEALAMAEMPGLRRLWQPFHQTACEGVAAGVPTVTTLFRRLARAIIDPAFEDPDDWVRKGRDMFLSSASHFGDPSISRQLAGPLGYDVGQRRLQFNAKDYVVMPVYRDDGTGLWEPRDPPDDETAFDADTSFARSEKTSRNDVNRGGSSHPDTERHSTVLPIQPRKADALRTLGRYPEFDYRSYRRLPDWVTVKAYPTGKGQVDFLDTLKSENAELIENITISFKAVHENHNRRCKRQSEGPILDLNAAVDAVADLRRAQMPDERVFETHVPRPRDLAVSILLDVSSSTADRLPDNGKTVLEVQREATGILAHALDAAADRFAVSAFNSDGREDVRVFSLKDFDEALGPAFGSALSGLCPAYSTRIGAALRHAGTEIADQRKKQRLVLLLTDGEPSDIDCPDPDYLIEDARAAVQELSSQGIHVFGISLGRTNSDVQTRIFGPRGFRTIDRISTLPQVLPGLYAKLTQ